MREAAADRAACADLKVADLGSGVGERGELCANGLVVRDIAMGRECPDHDRPVGLGADLVQRRDAAEVDERLGLREPKLHQG